MIREYLADLDKKEQGESADIVRQISHNEQASDGQKSRTNAQKDFEEQVQTQTLEGFQEITEYADDGTKTRGNFKSGEITEVYTKYLVTDTQDPPID